MCWAVWYILDSYNHWKRLLDIPRRIAYESYFVLLLILSLCHHQEIHICSKRQKSPKSQLFDLSIDLKL